MKTVIRSKLRRDRYRSLPKLDGRDFFYKIVQRMNGTDDEFVPEGELEEGPGLIKKLREKLKKAVEEKQEYLEGWQRSRADFANYKREEASLNADKEARLKAELLESLLPTLDSLEMSLRHAQSKELELVRKQFLDALKRFGVEQYGQAGDSFDPSLHEALRQIPTEHEEEDHTIHSVERSGYKVGNTIIRPAQVTIKNHG